MAPDPDIYSWVLEFLLRQPNVEQWLANELLRALPLPSPLPFRLHKALLLRRLAGFPSLRTLHSLELLDDLHFLAAAPSSASASMSAAYRAVALHCAADALSSSGTGPATALLENLCSRVDDLARAEPALLDREVMMGLRMDVEAAAMTSNDARAALLGRDTRSEAVEAVRVYVREAVQDFGPSFLEMVADVVTANGIELAEPDNEVAAEKGLPGNSGGARYGNSGSSGAALNHSFDNEIDSMEERIQVSPTICQSSDGHRVSMVGREHDPTRHTPSCIEKIDTLATPDVEKVENALKTSCLELKLAVEDPLPKAIAMASEISSSSMGKMTNDGEREDIQYEEGARRIPSTVETIENDAEHGGSCSSLKLNQKPSAGKQLEGDKRTADSNSGHVAAAGASVCSNATTSEWEDDDMPEFSSHNFLTKTRLPSPHRTRISPLKLVQDKTFTRRRRVKRWSVIEEDTLRKAVETHGMGNWKTILNCYSDIFEERTEVDLKDKWRNMIRH